MKVEPLNGDYCPACAWTLNQTKIVPGVIVPMCKKDLDTLIRVGDYDIINRLVREKENNMQQQIMEKHDNDAEGKPAGGVTTGLGIYILWQNGPLGRGTDRQTPNGAFVEGVISAAIGRLEYYQRSGFASPYNDTAIADLKSALLALEQRTRDREAREVEGTHGV